MSALSTWRGGQESSQEHQTIAMGLTSRTSAWHARGIQEGTNSFHSHTHVRGWLNLRTMVFKKRQKGQEPLKGQQEAVSRIVPTASEYWDVWWERAFRVKIRAFRSHDEHQYSELPFLSPDEMSGISQIYTITLVLGLLHQNYTSQPAGLHDP